MLKRDERLDARLSAAKEKIPTITANAYARIAQSLKGEMCDGALTQAQLTAMAKALIADTSPPAPKG